MKQYNIALQYANYDPDIAFLNLVESGELLSNCLDVDKENLISDEDKTKLKELKEIINETTYKYIKSKFRQLLQKYTYVLTNLLDDDFFENRHIVPEIYAFNRSNIQEYIKGTYNLRSVYVHRGGSFGIHTMPKTPPFLRDFNNSWSNCCSKKMIKALQKSASFTGLESIIYYCINKLLINFQNNTLNNLTI